MNIRVPYKYLLKSFLLSFMFAMNTEAAWSPPIPVSPFPSSTGPVGNPIAINSNSTALVGWLDGPLGLGTNTFTATLSPQNNFWSSAESFVSTTPGQLLLGPVVAFDESNNEYAFTLSFIPGLLTLYQSKRPSGSTIWPAPITQVDTTGQPLGATVGIDNLGNTFAFLSLSSTGFPPFNHTLFTLAENNTAWSTPIIVAVDNSTFPTTGGDSNNGKGVFVWKMSTPSLQIQSARYTFSSNQLIPNGNIAIPTTVPPVSDIVALRTVVKNDNAITVIATSDGTKFNLFVSTLLAGQYMWSAPQRISDPANGVSAVGIASDPFGNVMVIWSESINANHLQIKSVYIPLGGSPIEETVLADVNAINVTSNATIISIDSFGNAVAIWSLTVGGTPDAIQVASKPFNQNWSVPDTLSPSGSNPFVVISDQGTAVAVWNDGITNILLSSRNSNLFPLMGGSGFIGKIVANRFASQTEYSLRMEWSQSLAPDIIRYEIRKNGILVTVIPPTGPFKYVAHNQRKHIKDTYTLSTVASNGNTSTQTLTIVNN